MMPMNAHERILNLISACLAFLIKVRERVKLEPLVRKADKGTSKVEGGMPLSGQSGYFPASYALRMWCTVDEIDEID